MVFISVVLVSLLIITSVSMINFLKKQTRICKRNSILKSDLLPLDRARINRFSPFRHTRSGNRYSPFCVRWISRRTSPPQVVWLWAFCQFTVVVTNRVLKTVGLRSAGLLLRTSGGEIRRKMENRELWWEFAVFACCCVVFYKVNFAILLRIEKSID